MSCTHNKLDRTKNWFWGYLHAEGTIHVKRLYINPRSEFTCDLCHAMVEKEHPNSFIKIITSEPVEGGDTHYVHALISYNIGIYVGRALQRGDKVFTTQYDRFELIEFE